MSATAYLTVFFSALFLCNCIPHLAAGLSGEPFPSPFASPPGKGNSPPVVNFLWGAFNLIVGCALYSIEPFSVGLNILTSVFFAGFILFGIFTSINFGKVWQQRR